MDDAFAFLLAKDEDRVREEPQIAANIGAQLEHMALTSQPLSIRRRLRDVVGRLKPNRFCEIGAGIGHLSAWFFDMWEQDGQHPERVELIEGGAKFGVILTRLIRRYGAEEWAGIKVGNFQQLAAETSAWLAANTSLTSSAGQVDESGPMLATPYDCIVIDVGLEGLAECVEAALPLLAPGGVLLTVEPLVPTDNFDESDERGMAIVNAFQGWMDLIQDRSKDHLMAFQPLYGGTIVAIVNQA